MNIVFYTAGAIAVLSTLWVIRGVNPIHSLLCLIVSLLSVALVFYALGAPFVAALEVIIYAGAIVVLFVFVVMTLNLGRETVRQEVQFMSGRIWLGPILLTGILAAQLFYCLIKTDKAPTGAAIVDAKQFSLTLFGRYLIIVELASVLLLAGLVGAYHLGRGARPKRELRKP